VPPPAGIWVSAVVEGDVDEAVLTRLTEACGLSISTVFGRNGKNAVHQRLEAYNKAARYSPWIVLLDLDNDAQCAPALVSRLLPNSTENLCLRIAVRAIESWLLADQLGVSRFLGIRRSQIPDFPDELSDPKAFLVDLARRSRRTDIRREMAPRPGSGKRVGPAYSSRVIEFTLYNWDCAKAEGSSQSLKSCKLALQSLAKRISSTG
jgi:hypothetical protein